jgi:endonuclease/exonuclease/phosphatase (EEP) superfamily protein YafD
MPGPDHGTPPARPRPWRRLERAAATALSLLALAAFLVGLVGPRLGDGPGLPGWPGFLCEVVSAMWLQGGVLAAFAAGISVVRRLRAPAVAFAAVALAILVPQGWAAMTAPATAPSSAPTLRVAAVNLCEDNHDVERMAACLRALDADVLVLAEFTDWWAARLLAAFPVDYPHRWTASAPPHKGLVLDGLRVAVWSRLPADGEPTELHLLGVNAQIRVPLRWQGRAFALYGLHPNKPFPFRVFRRAHRERQQLLQWLEGERLPAVVAGDLNATPRGAFFVRLQRLGLTSASQAVCGRAPTTWPMHPPQLAPFRVAIDHVLHSDAWAAVGFTTSPANGSDHIAVVADLVWRTP